MITRHSLQADADPAKSLRILLAEDNPVNQKLATRLLEKRGHRVIIASNGREALLALEKGAYDLVLMDVHMPEMDGLEATKLLREKEKSSGHHQAVVAMTALVMKGDHERCVAAGMDGYLSKPIRPLELDEVLDAYLARARAEFSVVEPGEFPGVTVCAEEILERVDGDRSFLWELLLIFRFDYPGQIRMAREAVTKKDSVALQTVGHALKGALVNLAAPIASRIAGELESMAMATAGEIALAGEKVDELEEALIRVVVTLEDLCAETVK